MLAKPWSGPAASVPVLSSVLYASSCRLLSSVAARCPTVLPILYGVRGHSAVNYPKSKVFRRPAQRDMTTTAHAIRGRLLSILLCAMQILKDCRKFRIYR